MVKFLYHRQYTLSCFLRTCRHESHAQLFVCVLKAISALLYRKWNRPVKLINRLNNKTGNVRINITLRCAGVTIVAVEKKWVLQVLCVCSLRYRACNVHVPYCTVLCGLSGSTVFFNVISHRTSFGKKVTKQKLFWFSPQLSSKTFLTLRKIQRGFIINV